MSMLNRLTPPAPRTPPASAGPVFPDHGDRVIAAALAGDFTGLSDEDLIERLADALSRCENCGETFSVSHNHGCDDHGEDIWVCDANAAWYYQLTELRQEAGRRGLRLPDRARDGADRPVSTPEFRAAKARVEHRFYPPSLATLIEPPTPLSQLLDRTAVLMLRNDQGAYVVEFSAGHWTSRRDARIEAATPEAAILEALKVADPGIPPVLLGHGEYARAYTPEVRR